MDVAALPETRINQGLIMDAVSVQYGDMTAIDSVSLALAPGQIGCLLGPSGCGKSTLLRTIAGFERVASGAIQLFGRTLSTARQQVPPENRNIGMVFQDIALFPHLTVAQNVAFGLKGRPKAESKRRVDELLELVGLPGAHQRYPNSLSGGQQQRIALARALAHKPLLLLLDEPFSGLDATLKESLVPEVRRILIREKITALMVTHDQMEAFVVADQVAVMNQARIEQTGTPYEIYHKPGTRFVADFVGQGKFLPATVLNDFQVNTDLGILDSTTALGFPEGAVVDILIRPDDVQHDDTSNFFGVISNKQFRGTFFQYQVLLANGLSLMCMASGHHNHAIGERIGIRLDLDHIILFSR